MARQHRSKSAYTLIEMLLVVSVVSVLAALIITGTDPGAHDRLNSLAQVIQTDLTYARSLAVANGTPYTLTFDASNGQYTLTHSGDDDAWDSLPPSPFHSLSQSSAAQIVNIDELPHIGGNVQILGAFTVADDDTLTRVDSVTFGTIGETQDRAEETVIWLSAGLDTELRYLSILINPVTGLVDIEDFTGVAPAIDEPAGAGDAPPGGFLL
jgi:prepilin-type N-terminal cleavage/methylation domain-containing protein